MAEWKMDPLKMVFLMEAQEISICSHISFTEGQWIPRCQSDEINQALVFLTQTYLGELFTPKKGAWPQFWGYFKDIQVG